MSKLSDDTYRTALKRAVEAKWKMDRAIAELDRAEDEYRAAIIALDQLEEEMTS